MKNIGIIRIKNPLGITSKLIKNDLKEQKYDLMLADVYHKWKIKKLTDYRLLQVKRSKQ